MKRATLLAAILLTINSYGQQAKPVKDWKPIWLFDSVRINNLTDYFFDQHKIADINVEGTYFDSTNQIHGKIFLTSKDPNNYHFISLDDVTKAYKKIAYSSAIFMIDNVFIKNAGAARIDASYILKVEITGAHEFDNVKHRFSKMKIIKITTASRENIDTQNKLRIRG